MGSEFVCMHSPWPPHRTFSTSSHLEESLVNPSHNTTNQISRAPPRAMSIKITAMKYVATRHPADRLDSCVGDDRLQKRESESDAVSPATPPTHWREEQHLRLSRQPPTLT